MGTERCEASTASAARRAAAAESAAAGRLGASSEICDSNNLVAFGAKGGMVVNLDDPGPIAPFHRVGKTYELNTWVKKQPNQPTSGFARQGRIR